MGTVARPAGRGRAGWAILALLWLGGPGAPLAVADDPPRRLVALAPNVVELLFALGLGDRVVGVGDYVRWPPAVESLPRLGGLLDPHVEQMVALRPDLAVLLPSERERAQWLEMLGIPVLTVPAQSLGDIAVAARRLGERCAVEEAAASFVRSFEAQLEPRPQPQRGRPTVLLAVGRSPGQLGQIFVAGPGTFLDELLGRLGAANLFADAPLPYPQVGLEEIVARDPDVIIELQGASLSEQRRRELEADWRRLASLTAVRERRIEVVASDYVLIPGPRLPLLYADLRRALAP